MNTVALIFSDIDTAAVVLVGVVIVIVDSTMTLLRMSCHSLGNGRAGSCHIAERMCEVDTTGKDGDTAQLMGHSQSNRYVIQ